MNNRKIHFTIAVIFFVIILISFIVIISKMTSDIEINHEVSEDKTTINLITNEDIPSLLISEFEKIYPNYYINIQKHANSNYSSVLKSKIKSDNQIDLILVPTSEYANFVQSNMLYDITKEGYFYHYNKASKSYLKELSQSDSYYGIPYQSDYIGIWYNKAIFSKYHLTPPDNIDSLIDACKVLKMNHISPLTMGLKDPLTAQLLLSIFLTDQFINGVPLFNTNMSQTQLFNDKRFEQALERLEQFIQNGYMSEDSPYMTTQQAFNSFIESSSAMIITTEDSTSMITNSTYKLIDFDINPVKINTSNQKTVLGSPVKSIISIYSGSDQINICNKFLEYLSSYETANLYTDAIGKQTNIATYKFEGKVYESWNDIKQNAFYDIKPWSLLYTNHPDSHDLYQQFIIGLLSPEELIVALIEQVQDEERRTQ